MDLYEMCKYTVLQKYPTFNDNFNSSGVVRFQYFLVQLLLSEWLNMSSNGGLISHLTYMFLGFTVGTFCWNQTVMLL